MSNGTVEFEVELFNPITISSGGATIDALKVLLRAPASRNRREASRIKRICNQAVMSYQSSGGEKEPGKSEGSKDEEITANEIINMLAGASHGDENMLEVLYDLFGALLVAGCGLIEGEKFTKDLYGDLSYEDVENLFGEYVKHFLLASLFKTKSGKKLTAS